PAVVEDARLGRDRAAHAALAAGEGLRGSPDQRDPARAPGRVALAARPGPRGARLDRGGAFARAPALSAWQFDTEAPDWHSLRQPNNRCGRDCADRKQADRSGVAPKVYRP